MNGLLDPTSFQTWLSGSGVFLAQESGATGATGASGATGATGAGSNSKAGAKVDGKAVSAADQALALAKHYLPAAIGVLVILLVAWIGANWARAAARRGLTRAKFDPTLGKFLSNMLRWAVLILAVIMCFQVVGIEPTSFAALIAAAGLAIGLALQGSLSNLAAGIMLLIFRPFKVADLVNISGQIGKVNEIDLMMTELDTLDGRRVIIPNGQIFGAIIENVTYHPKRRVDVPVGVAYGADIDQTRAVLEAAVRTIPAALTDPPPDVVLMGLGASSVDWQLRVWAGRDDFLKVKQGTVRAAKVALDEAGISIPFPQMDVWLRRDQDTVVVGGGGS